MLKELLIKALKSLKPEEKQNVRELLEDTPQNNDLKGEELVQAIEEVNIDENKSDTQGEIDNNKGDETMSNENNANDEEKKALNEKTTEKVEETTKVENSEQGNGDVSKTTDNQNGTTSDQQPSEQNNIEQVQETEPMGNGIRIEDLVTKDDLMARFSAFEAKFNAVIKENEDLKNELSGMKDKYENKDFGALQKKGVDTNAQSANDTFEEYSKNFM